MFGLNKGGGSPTHVSGPMMASPRPMPNPANGGQPTQGGQGGGLFPNLSHQQRYDMTMDLLKQGMSSAAASGSPLAAFLAPLAGAAIGGSAGNRLAKAQGSEQDALAESLIPGGLSGRAKELVDIIDNPDAPDYLKSLAKDQLKEALKPAKASGGGGGGKRSGGGGGGAKPSVNIYGEYVGEDGIVRGRARDGTMRPYIDENGKPIKKLPKGAAPAAAAAPVVIDGYTIEPEE